MKILNIILITFLLRCNNKENDHNIITRTLEFPHKKNCISLIKDTVLYEKDFNSNYSLKDNYRKYQLKSFNNIKNIKYSGGSIELIKDVNLKKNAGFILNYKTRDYDNYSFFEYEKESLYVKCFVEIINADNKITAESKSSNDTIAKIKIKVINVRAEKFFSDSYIFDSIEPDLSDLHNLSLSV